MCVDSLDTLAEDRLGYSWKFSFAWNWTCEVGLVKSDLAAARAHIGRMEICRSAEAMRFNTSFGRKAGFATGSRGRDRNS
jgi:hypothetical protein